MILSSNELETKLKSMGKKLTYVTWENNILTGYCKVKDKENCTKILYSGKFVENGVV